MHNFRNLKVWQKSVDFAVKIYQTTAEFPQDEKFGMSSQMKRAPSNIAEGSSKSSKKSFCNSLERREF